jgi:hypothetical protein
MIRDVIYTEGVKYVADNLGAYWLIDEIAFAQKYAPRLRNEDFQNWELVVSAGGSAVLTCDDGNGHGSTPSRLLGRIFPRKGSGSISAKTRCCCRASIDARTMPIGVGAEHQSRKRPAILRSLAFLITVSSCFWSSGFVI